MRRAANMDSNHSFCGRRHPAVCIWWCKYTCWNDSCKVFNKNTFLL